MSEFFKAIDNSIKSKIDYFENLRTGEVTVDNGDGTYDVKIANSDSAYPDVETLVYGDIFSVGEVVTIGFEYGSKESPKILGHSKKIAQEPKDVEVDYSGESEGGQQTVIATGYSSANDGTISNYNASYATSHDAASGYDKYDGLDEMIIAYNYLDYAAPPVGVCHGISRSFIFFDTSDIPAGTNITIAILYLRAEAATTQIDTAFDVVIQDGQPDYPHTTLALADFNYTYYKNNGGSINAGDISTSAYTAITLNSNGRNWINKGGTTKLCLRSSREIAGVEYTGAAPYYEMVGIWASEKGAGYKPKLVVTYTI